MQTIGNLALLQQPDKIGFLCSRAYTAASVIKSFDWALAQKQLGRCVVSGFHSPLERNIIKFLLNGSYPIIAVLSRGLYKELPEGWATAVEKGTMLVVSPFELPPPRPTAQTAETRNRWILENTPTTVIGYQSAGGNLSDLLSEYIERREIIYL